MSAFYKKMEATAKRLVKKFGQPVSIVKRHSDTGGYDEWGNEITPPQDETGTGLAVASSYKKEEINGTSIISGDIKLTFVGDMISSGMEPNWWSYFFSSLNNNDDSGVGIYIEWNGRTYRVMSSDPVTPANINICYRLQLRS